MQRDELMTLIVTSVKEFTQLSDSTQKQDFESLNEETRLFGGSGLLDSLGLVSVLMDIEQQLNDRLNLSITIADERAMSQERSPFRTIGSLTDYVLVLIKEQQGA